MVSTLLLQFTNERRFDDQIGAQHTARSSVASARRGWRPGFINPANGIVPERLAITSVTSSAEMLSMPRTSTRNHRS